MSLLMQDDEIPEQESIHDDAYKTIADLLDEAPDWSPAYAAELATLVRSHLAIRCALAFAKQLAEGPLKALKVAATIEDVKRFQGNIEGLEKYLEILTGEMMTAEQPHEPEDEEQDADPQPTI